MWIDTLQLIEVLSAGRPLNVDRISKTGNRDQPPSSFGVQHHTIYHYTQAILADDLIQIGKWMGFVISFLYSSIRCLQFVDRVLISFPEAVTLFYATILETYKYYELKTRNYTFSHFYV